MGRRKRKKAEYRKKKTVPKVFQCPKCGHRTIKMKKGSKTDTSATLVCGFCRLEKRVSFNEIFEPVDAYGELIDLYYTDQELDRLTRMVDKYAQLEQYTLLAPTYAHLAYIHRINETQAKWRYEESSDPAEEQLMLDHRAKADEYKRLEIALAEEIQLGLKQDRELDDDVYEEAIISVTGLGEEGSEVEGSGIKPKRGVPLEDVLDDLGFLEF
jgi:transcription elongation factor Elf1